MIEYYIIYILAGLVVGSFLNVIILRLKTAESFLIDRSRCPKCKKEIKWYDLFPIISYLILRAKCRNCKKPISGQYPLVEATTAALFALSYYLYNLTWQSLVASLLFSLFVVLVTSDLIDQLVPEIISWGALIVAILYQLIFNYNALGQTVLGALVGGGVIAFLVIISKGRWMGDGDIKIATAIGIFLSFPLAITGIFFAFITGAVLGSLLIALKHKKAKDSLPFTPFLFLGLLISLVWGQCIIDWYLGRFII